MLALLAAALLCTQVGPGSSQASPAPADGPVTIRVATYNVEDVRTEDLENPTQPRLKRLAENIQRIRPNVILVAELAYDMPGSPGFKEGSSPGRNAQRFADAFLAVPQAEGLKPLKYKAYMPPTNTGVASGFDLDRDGQVTLAFPTPPGAKPDGSPGDQTPAGRKYGGDCWGFGTFPGQYAFALLVDERLTINEKDVRTFRLLPWDYVPGAFLPATADGKPWYDGEAKTMRLSSKNHADIPVTLPNGAVVHFLCSHPTPPAFDGPEMRNKKRNHDEIRLWADYIAGESYIVDDANRDGGLPRDASFVILGDLNADPKDGDSFKNPIRTQLEGSAKLRIFPAPTSEIAVPGLDPDDTSLFKLRVDYVLPSRDLEILGQGVWRGGYDIVVNPDPKAEHDAFPSDHFPVWVDVRVPSPRRAPATSVRVPGEASTPGGSPSPH